MLDAREDIDRRTFLRGVASIGVVTVAGGVIAACSGGSNNASGATTAGHIRTATAVTEVLGAGLTLVAIALEYDEEIDGSSLDATDFAVEGRNVTKVYTNSTAATGTSGTAGNFVIVELDTGDDAALLWDSESVTIKEAAATVTATVTATGSVTTAGGESYEDAGTVTTTAAVDPLADLFAQQTFEDPDTGDSLPYNIFVPAGVDANAGDDSSETYPLVIFMHDASVVGAEDKGPLAQGQGAVCWVSPEDQECQPCIVVAPQYPEVVVVDDYQPTSYLDTTVNLVKDLIDRYPVDPDRVHATGQSMVGMMTLGMNIEHPDLFDSSYVVAAQWPAEDAGPLAEKKLWVTVSEGDEKAYPMQNDIMDVIKDAGTEVTEASWDATWDTDRLDSEAQDVADAGTQVNYTTFKAGTVPGADEGGASEDMGTWQVAYAIPTIRDHVLSV